MSVLDDFIAATAVKIDSIAGLLHVPTRPDQPLGRTGVCLDKAPGSSVIRLMASQLMDVERGDFPIIFDRLEVVEPGDSRTVVRLTSSQDFDQPLKLPDPAPEVQLRTVSGHLTLVLQRIARDENDCAGHPKRYSLSLAVGASSVLTALDIGVDYLGTRWGITADHITIAALVGGEIPPPPPDLHLLTVGLSGGQCGTRAVGRVGGSVRLSRAVLPSDDRTQVALTVAGSGPVAPTIDTPVVVTQGSRMAYFQVHLPAGYTGHLQVTATFGTETRTAEMEVVETPPFICAPRDVYLLDHRRLPFPDPCLACSFWRLTEHGDLLAMHEGRYYRQRSDGPPVELGDRVGGAVRRAAMNMFGQVAGSALRADGALCGFILLADETSPAIVLDGVQLAAINDDGLAVGYQLVKQHMTAFAFALERPKAGQAAHAKGAPVPLPTLKAAQAQAVAVNDQGQILVLASKGKDSSLLLLEKGHTTDLGPIPGLFGVHALTDSGFVLGNARAPGKPLRPFLLLLDKKDSKHVEIPVLPGFDAALATSINEGGMVVGRAFQEDKSSASRGFRFTNAFGVQDLNALVKLPDGFVITAGLLTSHSGEILVEIARGAEIGQAVLVPQKG